MVYKTFLEIATLVKNELDLQEEAIISDTELKGYINRAVEIAESNILTIYEDYFITSAPLSLVLGTDSYVLPATIFANKIRAVVYQLGTLVYNIKRLKGYNLYERVAEIQSRGLTDMYQYILKNRGATSGVELVLLPASRETGAYVTIWFIRNAQRYTADSDLCDIPEFEAFIVEQTKFFCLNKEGSALADGQKIIAGEQLKLMVDTLSAMVPDEDNFIEVDTGFYDSHA